MDLRKLYRFEKQIVSVYDNYNWKETVRDEQVGHRAIQSAMTTATIVHCSHLPVDGLKQSMINHKRPLDITDVYRGCSQRPNAIEMTRFLIADAIRQIFEKPVEAIFEDSSIPFPDMPIMDILPPTKTREWQLGAIYEDEGTIAGTYNVHESIFIKQLGLRTPAKSGI
jgi:hypothetical protein